MLRSVLIDLDSTVFNTDECVEKYLRTTVNPLYKHNILSYDFNKTAKYLFEGKGTDEHNLDLGITRRVLSEAYSTREVFDDLDFYPGVVDSLRGLINLGIHVTFKTRVSGTEADGDIIMKKYSLLNQALTGSYSHFDMLVLDKDSPIDMRYDAIFDDNINEYLNALKRDIDKYKDLGTLLSEEGDLYLGERKFYLMDKSYNSDWYLNALFYCTEIVPEEVYKASKKKPYVKVNNLIEGIADYVGTLPLIY